MVCNFEKFNGFYVASFLFSHLIIELSATYTVVSLIDSRTYLGLLTFNKYDFVEKYTRNSKQSICDFNY